MSQNVSKCLKMSQNVSKCLKMSQNVSKCLEMSRNVSKCLYRDISETFLPTYWLHQFLIPNVLSAFSGTIFNIFLQQTRTILTIVRLFGPSNSLRLAFVILSTPTIRKIFIERVLIILWEYQYSLSNSEVLWICSVPTGYQLGN